MLPDRVSNPGPLTYESGALPIALRGPAVDTVILQLLCDIGHRFWWINFNPFALKTAKTMSFGRSECKRVKLL